MTASAVTVESINKYIAETRPMLIGGDWVMAECGETFPVYDPSTGEVIANVAEGRKEDVDKAVAAARATFESQEWRHMMPAQRAGLMFRLADLLEENIQELTELEVLNQGKPVGEAQAIDLPATIGIIRYYAGAVTKIEGQTTSISIPDMRGKGAKGPAYHSYTLKEPVGVVGQIIPWNFPLLMIAMKLGPSLAAGCCSVLKPAEETPLTALRFGELVLEAGFPPGVVNVVPGYGETAGAAIAAHPDLDKVAFTGSGEVGRLIAQAATGNLKKVTLELGGKSPVVVLADANMDVAVPGAAGAIFLNGGQVCVAGSRIYAEHKVFDQVVEGVAGIAKGMKVGPGLDPTTQMGPLVSSKQQERVCGYIEMGKEEGAEIVTGGVRSGNQGFFVEPTVMVNTNNKMKVVQEEIFGPVVSAQPIKDISEIEPLANDSVYGLAASIWTTDLSKAHVLASQIRAGSIWVNCHALIDAAMPFGGFKESGWGRENGMAGLENYLETKSVVMAL